MPPCYLSQRIIIFARPERYCFLCFIGSVYISDRYRYFLILAKYILNYIEHPEVL